MTACDDLLTEVVEQREMSAETDGARVAQVWLPMAMSETTERYFVQVLLLGAVKGEWRKMENVV